MADFAFAGGMAGVGTEAFFAWLSLHQSNTEANLVTWQQGYLLATAALPFFWLVFSLSYARGNAREFISKWSLMLGAALVLPAGIAVAFRRQLIAGFSLGPAGTTPALLLGPPGLILQLLVLVAAILVLMNLERTFRASVGTMRWRIKFMLIGIGVLFFVRIYTACQEILFHAVTPSLEELNSGALVVVFLLLLRSFFRVGPRDLDVYPSHTVLRGSVTVLLAGVYLLIVGLLAKAVAVVGTTNVFALEAILGLVALVVFVVLLQSDGCGCALGDSSAGIFSGRFTITAPSGANLRKARPPRWSRRSSAVRWSRWWRIYSRRSRSRSGWWTTHSWPWRRRPRSRSQRAASWRPKAQVEAVTGILRSIPSRPTSRIPASAGPKSSSGCTPANSRSGRSGSASRWWRGARSSRCYSSATGSGGRTIRLRISTC